MAYKSPLQFNGYGVPGPNVYNQLLVDAAVDCGCAPSPYAVPGPVLISPQLQPPGIPKQDPRQWMFMAPQYRYPGEQPRGRHGLLGFALLATRGADGMPGRQRVIGVEPG